MSQRLDRPVYGSCRKVFNEQLDESDAWHDGPFQDEAWEREHDYLCPECYEVVVEGAPETREWIATE